MAQVDKHTVEELHRQYMDGVNPGQIAESCGFSRQRLHQLFHEHGLDTHTRHEAGQIRYQQNREKVAAHTDAIRSLFDELAQQGHSSEAIIKQIGYALDVSQKALRELLATELSVHARSKTTAPTYTDEELFAFMREAAVGGKLTHTRYKEYAEGRFTDDGRPWPVHLTIMIRFDKWSTAVQKAGLRTTARKRQRTTADECAKALGKVINDLGHIPTVEQYRAIAQKAKEEGEELPSPDLIRIRCGTWGNAVKQATASN